MRCVLSFVFLLPFTLSLALNPVGFEGSQDDVKQLILQLNDTDYERRQEAKVKLREFGASALPDLEQAICSTNPLSVSSVCLELIVELFESNDDQSRKAAKDALIRLSSSKSKLISNRAKLVLDQPKKELSVWIEKSMKGMIVRDSSREGKPIVEVKLDRTRGLDPGFHTDQIRNEEISKLRILEQLNTLTLASRSNINDTVFEHLAKLHNLRDLDLANTAITGSGFSNLPTTSKIDTLNLSYCPKLNELLLKDLARLPGLRTITLNGRGSAGWSDDTWRYNMAMIRHMNSYRNSEMQQLRGGVGDSGIENLCKATGLESISITCTQITDQALGNLATLPNLRALNLEKTAVTNAGIKLLEGSALEELSLSFTFLTDEGVSSLAKMKNLRRLDLSNTALSSKGIEAICRLPNLEQLNLSYTPVNDKHLEALQHSTTLRKLELKRTAVTFDGLLMFAKAHPNISLPQLVKGAGFSSRSQPNEIRGLSLKRQKLSERSIDAIVQMKQLSHLDLTRTSITDEQLARLNDLSNLSTLNLSFTGVTDKGISKLDSLTNLNRLITNGSKATFTGMRKLFCDQMGRSSLELIEVGSYRDSFISRSESPNFCVDLVHRGVTDRDLETLAKLSDCYSLKLAGNSLTDEGLFQIPPESTIELLWISGDGITSASLHHLSKFPRLKTLWITHGALESDSLSILTDFKTLETLNLCGCPIDDRAISHLAHASSLKTLLVDHFAFSNEGFDRLQELRPNLEVIRSKQSITRLISNQKTHYQLPWQRGSNIVRSGRVLEHPLTRLFGKEFFYEFRSLGLPDEFDCSLLSRLESLESIFFGENIVREGALGEINHLPNLKRISLYRAYIQDSELRHLSGMTQLEELVLERSTITAEGLKHLKDMTGLKLLQLGGYSSKLAPGFSVCLDEMPALQELKLFRVQATDEFLNRVVKLKALRKLSLRATRIGEEVTLLSEMGQLEELDLGSSFITDKELEQLSKLNLKTLTVDYSFVSESGIQKFKKANPDTRLSSGALLSEEVLKIVEPLRQKRCSMGRNKNKTVSYLDIRRIDLDPDTIGILTQLPELTELRMKGEVTDELIGILITKPNFHSLLISHGSISKSQLERLRELPSFNNLRLYDCQISRDAFKIIGDMTRLRSLTLNKTSVDENLINDQHVKSLKNLTALTWLGLNDTAISDESMVTIASFKNMQRLFLNRTGVTDNGIYPVTRWRQLSEITAVGTQVTRNEAEYGRRRVETRSSR